MYTNHLDLYSGTPQHQPPRNCFAVLLIRSDNSSPRIQGLCGGLGYLSPSRPSNTATTPTPPPPTTTTTTQQLNALSTHERPSSRLRVILSIFVKQAPLWYSQGQTVTSPKCPSALPLPRSMLAAENGFIARPQPQRGRARNARGRKQRTSGCARPLFAAYLLTPTERRQNV